eukprot:Clim_evm3s210 gene=Clim_evmTU3s210
MPSNFSTLGDFQGNRPYAPVPKLDEYHMLGNSGLRVSPLCLGAMNFGLEWGFGEGIEESKRVFDMFISKGGNFIDTANIYQNGDSERYLGDMIGQRRSDLVVATKYTIHSDMTMKDKTWRNPNAGGNHRKSLVESLDGSLKRMGLGAVDMLYVHVWEYRTPVQEVMRALDDVIRSGKVYYAAVSDTPAWKISEANTMAELRGWSPFIALQTRYNLLDRSMEYDLEPMARDNGLGIVPWGILAEGVLTGKHRGGMDNSTGRKDTVGLHLKNPRTEKIVDEVMTIAKETGKTGAQVSVNWMKRMGIDAPLVGARTVKQLEDNLGCLDFELSDDQMDRLNTVSNPDPNTIPFPYNRSQQITAMVDGGVKVDKGRMPTIRFLTG